MTINYRPVLPYITLQKDDASTYLYDPFTPTYNFSLQDLRFEPPHDSLGGTFEMTIMGATGANSEANTILSNVSEGNEVTIWIGKTTGTKSKIFLGVIEVIEVKENTKNMMQIVLSGPDWGSNLLKHRIVSDSWIQKKTADNITLDSTDNTVLISTIVKNLLDDSSGSYPDKLYPCTLTGMGVVYSASNVEESNIRMPQFESNFERIDDKLAELDDITGMIHYIDADKNFIMKNKESVVESGLLLIDDTTSSIGTAWDQTKLGYIRQGSVYQKSVEGHRRRLFGLGGGKIAIDQSATTVTSSTDMGGTWIAQRFTPSFTHCYNIGIYLGGTATVDLTLFLQEELASKPSGTTLRSLQVSKNVISATGGWVYFPIDEDLTVGRNYWIVLSIDTVGADTLAWYRNTSDSGANTLATSSNGTTWALTGSPNRFTMAHIVYTSDELVVINPSGCTVSQKHFWEDVIHRPDINDESMMRKYLTTVYPDVSRRKETFSCSIISPDTIPQIGHRVRVVKTSSGYAIDSAGTSPVFYTIKSIQYVFESGDDTQTGTYNFKIEAFKMSSFT